MNITKQKVIAVASCTNSIDIVLAKDTTEIVAQVMDENGNDLTSREIEIAEHIVNLWNQYID